MDKPFTITYTNSFKVDNEVFSFRKKELFNVTNIPIHLPLQNNSGSNGYWIKRKWFSLTKIKSIITDTHVTVDVSGLQWYQQINLDKVFNL